MSIVLDAIMKRFVRHGRLDIRYPDGSQRHYGPDDAAEPRAGLWLKTPGAVRGLILNPALRIPEAYMAGSLAPMDCSLFELLDMLMLNGEHACHPTAQLAHRGAPDQAFLVAVQSDPARTAQRGASLRSQRQALLAVSRSRPAIFLRLFRARRRDPGGGAGGEEASHRRQART